MRIRLFLIWPVLTLHLWAGASFAAAMQSETFRVPTSEGAVLTHCYAKAGGHSHTLVLLLHGVSGFAASQTAYEAYAEELVAHGHRVCAPEYYLGEDAEIMTGRDVEKRHVRYAQRLRVWTRIGTEILEKLGADLPGPHSTAVVGFSQGGFLAMAVAGARPQVGGLVVVYGGVPTPVRDEIGKLPPTLFLHGDADQTVPITEGYAARDYCAQRAPVCEMQVYPGAGHGFQSATMVASRQRIAGFLDRLQPAEAIPRYPRSRVQGAGR